MNDPKPKQAPPRPTPPPTETQPPPDKPGDYFLLLLFALLFSVSAVCGYLGYTWMVLR